VRLRSIVITHREPLAAEGIAAALGRYPQLVVEVAGTLQEAERRAGRADAIVIAAPEQNPQPCASAERECGW
jgi:hypothetical protein